LKCLKSLIWWVGWVGWVGRRGSNGTKCDIPVDDLLSKGNTDDEVEKEILEPDVGSDRKQNIETSAENFDDLVDKISTT
jgi:hypothetical protein